MIPDAELYCLRPRRAAEVGGEWDAVRAWPPRVRRRLTGAGYMGRRDGLAPDQLAHELLVLHGLDVSTCEAVELWRREVERIIGEERRAARRRRERRLAARHGLTWYGYRAAKYGKSVHEHARAEGWR